jgi:ribosomal protein S18 acetylase RimI-like enzyme
MMLHDAIHNTGNPVNTMHIRPADLADMDALLALDHSYTTDHVWQMSGQSTAAEHVVAFRLSKLPRHVQVPFPYVEAALRRCLHRCDYLWVMQGSAPRDVLGYIGMAGLPWQNTGWIPVLAVAPNARRKGIGTQLLRVAIAQARGDGLHSITLDVQTKNYPAARMCQARGFRFSGYADNYYGSHDIALFFAYRIR